MARTTLLQLIYGCVALLAYAEAGVNLRVKRQAVVGRSCTQSVTCGTGAYCSSQQRCVCLSTYVSINGFCWRKINPDEPGCSQNLQCSAVWPGAFCSSGTCRCANNQPGFLTRDGTVCVNYGLCPTGGDSSVQYSLPQGCGSGIVTDVLCGELYDCICTDSGCNNQGICCPSRAFTCMQEKDQGTGGAGFATRYWFNPITRQCETFTYAGSGGNGNNFQTLDQCQSYCLDLCERGHPLYTTAFTTTSTASKVQIRYCTQNTGGGTTNCDNNHVCTTVGTQSICCPTVSYICSRNGGIDYSAPGKVPLTSNFDGGDVPAGGTSKSLSRYYYDISDRTCKPFTFTGYGGNFNNFLSQEACRTYCAQSVCSVGTPLQDGSGNNRPCGTGCPSGYSCTSSVCCPSAATVCTLPQQAGPCFDFQQRWFYNSKTRNCETFTYSGCQGNDNNFATYNDCTNFCKDVPATPTCPQGEAYKTGSNTYLICGGTSATTTTCPTNYDCYYDGTMYGCCPRASYTCSLSFNTGVACGAQVTRYYYSSTTRRCEIFTYFGCGGNSNNFATQQDCEEYCGVGGCPYGGQPYVSSNGVYQLCGTSATSGTLGTCPSGYFCTSISILIGTTQQTNNYCCPTRSSVCLSPRLEGVQCTSTSVTRWFFNSATRNCEQFTYGGCSGNRNNFATREQCLAYCNSADCPDGQVALQSSVNTAIEQCVVGGTCSDSRYTCVQSTIFNTGICCGSNAPIDACPAGLTAWISPLTAQPLTCTANVVGACPGGYNCLYSATRAQYYCCGTPASAVCPQGGTPYYYPGTQTPFPCQPNNTASCASLGSQYTCQSRTVNLNGILSVSGTCCSPSTSQSTVCGTGYEPYLTGSLTSPVRCNPVTANICPSPSICRASPNTLNVYYCCVSTGTATNVCPAGYSPLTYNNDPVLCTVSSGSSSCLAGYQCLQYSGNGNFYCCRQGGTVTQPPLNSDPCPSPYRSPGNGLQYTQCSATQGCANLGAQYYCVSTSRGNYCCTYPFTVTTAAPVGDPQGCPAGYSFVPYGSTQLPLSCTPGSANQCPSSQCLASSIPGNNNICCRPNAG